MNTANPFFPVQQHNAECGRRVCAWCKPQRDLGPAPGLNAGEITHGICEECKREQLAACGIG